MPRFAIGRVADTPEVSVIRATCDGCDPPRVAEEQVATSRIWLVTAGCFELRDAHHRGVLDPATLVVFPAGHAFTIRHPRGPDTCVVFRGPLVDAIAGRGAGPRMPSPTDHAALLAEVAAWRRGEGDELALAAALGAAAAPAAAPAAGRRDRALADAIAHELRLDFAEATSLETIAARAGVSVFHASHVFRRVTGVAIHQFRRELRLRHALALLVDGRAPIAEVALATGFASQSHLTNRFRDRFGITPRAARLGGAEVRRVAVAANEDLRDRS